MEFRTKVTLPKGEAEIRHTDRIMVIGSCFSEQIGDWLQQLKFRCMVNPFGVLYNPDSIGVAVACVASGMPFKSSQLVKGDDGLWHSMLHHGSFSHPERKDTLAHINRCLQEAHEFLRQTDWLIVTLGSSFVYKNKISGYTVGNCHHFPASRFRRERLQAKDVMACCKSIIDYAREANPDIKVMFTVSPIRHLRDGLHENALSKANLLTGIDLALQERPRTYYFPAYEILLDELRDYRFYADDMLHPSQVAVDYIRQCFAETYFPPQTQTVLKEWEPLRLALNHRPLHPESEEYRRFVRQNMLKLQQLSEKFPYFELEKEIAACEALLKTE